MLGKTKISSVKMLLKGINRIIIFVTIIYVQLPLFIFRYINTFTEIIKSVSFGPGVPAATGPPHLISFDI